MITHRFYITSIIAIFLSLSLGILIGGTLGQQWLNDNQSKIITHYDNKAKELELDKTELINNNEKLLIENNKLKADYRDLFTSSINNVLDNVNILWLNYSEDDFSPLKTTIQLAGGKIYDKEENTTAFYQNITDENQINNLSYDLILFFPNGTNNLTNNQSLLSEIDIPIIYVSSNNMKLENLNREFEFYSTEINVNTFNEHYNFVMFLKNLLQEEI